MDIDKLIEQIRNGKVSRIDMASILNELFTWRGDKRRVTPKELLPKTERAPLTRPSFPDRFIWPKGD